MRHLAQRGDSLDTLEREGYQIARIPLGEMLWVLWRDNGTAAPE